MSCFWHSSMDCWFYVSMTLERLLILRAALTILITSRSLPSRRAWPFRCKRVCRSSFFAACAWPSLRPGVFDKVVGAASSLGSYASSPAKAFIIFFSLDDLLYLRQPMQKSARWWRLTFSMALLQSRGLDMVRAWLTLSITLLRNWSTALNAAWSAKPPCPCVSLRAAREFLGS